MNKKVFHPFYLGSYLLENRFVACPINLNLSQKGFVNLADIEFATRRAHSAPLTITGGLYVSENGKLFDYGISISDDKYIYGLSKLASAMKSKHKLAVAQLIHAGSHSLATLNEVGHTYGVSTNFLEFPQPHKVLELSKMQIEEIIKDYKNATKRAIKAGFDGIEISCAQKLLPQQFFSCFYNKRNDEYGCNTIENRSRFILQILEGVSQVIEEFATTDFILGFRFTPEETRGDELGYTIEDFIDLFEIIFAKKIKLSYLAIASWGRSVFLNKVRSKGIYYNELVSKVVYQYLNHRIPLIISGSINSAQKINQASLYADLIGITSAFVANPEFAWDLEKGAKDLDLSITDDKLKDLCIPPQAFQKIFSYFSFGQSLPNKAEQILAQNAQKNK